MDSSGDGRFDPNYAARLLLDIANEQSVDHLLQKLMRGALARPDIMCVQIWLIDKGDRCATCAHAGECRDRSRCLHLVAGAGKSSLGSAGEIPRFDDPLARMPMGAGLLGKVAATGQQMNLGDLGEQSAAMPGFEWLVHERIRGTSAAPIAFKGEVLGVIIGFTRADLPEESRSWSRIFADHIGAAMANARAFEEIQRLKSQLEMQNAYLQEEVFEAKAFGDLVGQSEVLRQVISQIDLVAPTEASVLILGETGTGKDLVAREIHRRSARRGCPLVRVNCASIPKDLFESEFFGHMRGAFTGAIKDRPGRFETAEGGRSSWMRLARFPWRCRRSSCASCRRSVMSASGMTGRDRRMCGSSGPPTGT